MVASYFVERRTPRCQAPYASSPASVIPLRALVSDLRLPEQTKRYHYLPNNRECYFLVCGKIVVMKASHLQVPMSRFCVKILQIIESHPQKHDSDHIEELPESRNGTLLLVC
jgi:hypothetical protein